MVRITVQVEDSLKDAIAKYAEENDMSVSQAVRKAINLLLAQSKDKE